MIYSFSLLFFSLIFSVANGSGFMQWSRPMPGPTIGSVGSVAGINVLSYKKGNCTWQTDIVSSSTGDLLLGMSQGQPFDTSIVITPAEDSMGYYTCQPFYKSVGEGSVSTQPTWCGVLQLSSTNGTAGAHIILPNASIVPLVVSAGPSLPWNCSEAFPCIVRSQELRTGQLGGCHRRKNSSITQTRPIDFGPVPSSPPQSTHVTLRWNDTLFLFRPLVIAAASSATEARNHIVAIPLASLQQQQQQQQQSTALAVDHQVQYVSVPYALGPDRAPSSNGTYAFQCLVCALALISSNGTVTLHDSDRDDVTMAGTGLPYLTSVSPSKLNGEGQCTPSIESVKRLLPCFNESTPVWPVNPLIYGTTLVLTCAATGAGYLLDIAVTGPGVYPAISRLVGAFSIPRELVGSDLSSGGPLSTDTFILLVQPRAMITNKQIDVVTYTFTPSYAFSVGVAVSRPPLDSNTSIETLGSSLNNTPYFAAMTFTSSTGTQTNASVYLTHKLVGQCTMRNITTDLYGASIQNVTTAIGWVTASMFPGTIGLESPNETQLDSLIVEAITSIAAWAATDGISYSMLTENLTVLVNVTSGLLTVPTNFTIDPRNVPHGGIQVAPQLRLSPYATVSRSQAIPIWNILQPATTPSLSSTKVVITSAFNENDSEGCPCVYALSSPNGILSSAISINVWFDPTVPPNIKWNIFISPAVYTPYSLYHCSSAPGGGAGGWDFAFAVPSVESLVLQLSNHNNSTAISIPLRDATAATNGESFGLNKPINGPDGSVGPTVAINPFGSGMTFVCSQDTLTAHWPSIGSELWSISLSTLPSCQNCGVYRCPSDAKLMTTSADQQFLIVHVVVEGYYGHSGTITGILAVQSTTGDVINFYGPDFFDAGSAECTTSPPTMANIGPIRQVINMPAMSDPEVTVAWAGIATVPGTSCFVVLSIFCSYSFQCSFSRVGSQRDTVPRADLFELGKGEAAPRLINQTGRLRHSDRSVNGLEFSGNIGILQGVWASFTSEVQLTAESIFLVSASGSEDRGKLSTIGNTAYIFSLSNVLTNGVGINDYSIVSPTFVANNVFDCAPVGALWFAVQLFFQRNQDPSFVTLALNVYQFSPQPTLQTQSVVATYEIQDPDLFSKLAKVSFFSLPRIRVPTVCVAASNITCFTANTGLSQESLLLSQGTVEYYGRPIVSDTCLIIFAQDGAPCRALIYTELLDAPRVLWEQPTWVGIDSGVDMDLNSSSCNNAVISSEGLLLMCKPSTQQGPLTMSEPRRRVYLLEARSGRVLLANGPIAVPTTTTLSDSGSTLTYVSATLGSTAYSVQLTGATAVEPVELRSSFCLSGISDTGKESNFAVVFNSDLQSIRATLTPWATAESVVDILITSDNSTVFPLSASQFRGFLGVRLGGTFALENSGTALEMLAEALPPVVAGEIAFTFVRGQPTVWTAGNFYLTVAYSDSCSTCDSNCPQFCGFDIISGEQYLYEMEPGSEVLTVSRRPMNFSTFEFAFLLLYPYSGNDSLTIARQEANVSGALQTYTGPDCGGQTQTTLATEARYCAAIPGLNGKTYVDIQIAFAFASVSSYTIQWGEIYFTSHVSVMPNTVWAVANVPSLVNLIQNAMINNAFPTSLSNTGAFISVSSVAIDTIIQAPFYSETHQLDVTMNTATGPAVVSLPTTACDSVDHEILVCPSAFASSFDPSENAKKSTRSIVWTSDAGNWGRGFVSTKFKVSIPDILRAPVNGTPVECGGELNSCISKCHPLSDCGTQLTAFFDFYLQTYSSQPLGSSVAVSAALVEACNATSISGTNLSSGIISTFYCSSDGTVTITTHTIDDTLLILGSFPSGVFDSFLGVTFSCSDCAYFMFYGLISQPVGWIAAGAVKSLVLTILFYILLDRMRAHNRLQIRLRGRHRQLAKRLDTLEERLREHELLLGHNEAGITEPFTTSYATTDPTSTAVSFSPTSKPVLAMSEGERSAEHHALKIEAARTRKRVEEYEAEVSAADSRRWACARWLPNPITLYSNVVIRLAGIRHPAERHALLVRVQDGLSSKDVTEQQLVTTLMHITGEGPSEQHMVSAFSQYYQWNMCLNRQVVIRDHIDDSAHAGAPMLGDMLDHALLKTHNSLRNVYKEFCVVMRDQSSPTSALPIQEAPSTTREITGSRRQLIISPEEEELLRKEGTHNIYTPTEDEQSVTDTPKRHIEEQLKSEAEAFIALIPSYPQCFEYVALPSRNVDDKLMPNTLLLLFSIGQFIAAIAVYSLDVTSRKIEKRSDGTRTSFDVYQSIFFMAFNSSTPSALLVSAISRADLGSLEQNQTWRTKLKDIFTDVYVWFVLILFMPPLATHVIPGIALYCWLLLPPLLASIGTEYFLRARLTSQTNFSIAARFLSRVLLLFVASMVSTMAYNYSAIYLYSSPEGYMKSGSYRKVGYFQTIVDDFDARSITCLYEHITTSASNFLQAGFASLY